MTMPTRGTAPPIATSLVPGLPGPLHPLCACQAYWQATAPPCRYARPAGPLHPFCAHQAYWRATAPPLCAPGLLAGHCTLHAPRGATAPLCRYTRPAGPLHPFCACQGYWQATAPPLCTPGRLAGHCTPLLLRAPGGATALRPALAAARAPGQQLPTAHQRTFPPEEFHTRAGGVGGYESIFSPLPLLEVLGSVLGHFSGGLSRSLAATPSMIASRVHLPNCKGSPFSSSDI